MGVSDIPADKLEERWRQRPERATKKRMEE
jgi:hypothetical protein